MHFDCELRYNDYVNNMNINVLTIQFTKVMYYIREC